MTMIAHRAHDSLFIAAPIAAPPQRTPWASALAAMGRITTGLLVWQERVRQRRQLAALGDLALKDFGRSRADAVAESEKPFWRA